MQVAPGGAHLGSVGICGAHAAEHDASADRLRAAGAGEEAAQAGTVPSAYAFGICPLRITASGAAPTIVSGFWIIAIGASGPGTKSVSQASLDEVNSTSVSAQRRRTRRVSVPTSGKSICSRS